jgi:hypothetical protein
MIRKLSNGKYRVYSHVASPLTGRLPAIGNFRTRAVAERHDREAQARADRSPWARVPVR